MRLHAIALARTSAEKEKSSVSGGVFTKKNAPGKGPARRMS